LKYKNVDDGIIKTEELKEALKSKRKMENNMAKVT
jgi:hypothetical protein